MRRAGGVLLAAAAVLGGCETIENKPTYVGGRLVVAESLSIVLSCDADRRLALAVEAA